MNDTPTASERMICTHCNNTTRFTYIEYVPSYRHVSIDADSGAVTVDDESIEYFESSIDKHFECDDCLGDVASVGFKYGTVLPY